MHGRRSRRAIVAVESSEQASDLLRSSWTKGRGPRECAPSKHAPDAVRVQHVTRGGRMRIIVSLMVRFRPKIQTV